MLTLPNKLLRRGALVLVTSSWDVFGQLTQSTYADVARTIGELRCRRQSIGGTDPAMFLRGFKLRFLWVRLVRHFAAASLCIILQTSFAFLPRHFSV